MESARMELPPAPSAAEPNPVFNVVIAYEDFETGKHAMKTYDFLVEHLGQDCQFSNQMWKFDVLSIPKLREIAANDAAQADIIMVSCHGESELPNHVLQWIDSWVSAEGNPIVLVALFDSEPAFGFGVRARLADAAKRAGIEFFAQPDEWPGRDQSSHRFTTPMNHRGSKMIPTLADAVHRQITPRWGINE
jgi:hypothetical protein